MFFVPSCKHQRTVQVRLIFKIHSNHGLLSHSWGVIIILDTAVCKYRVFSRLLPVRPLSSRFHSLHCTGISAAVALLLETSVLTGTAFVSLNTCGLFLHRPIPGCLSFATMLEILVCMAFLLTTTISRDYYVIWYGMDVLANYVT